jgi:hypothetical protein
MTHAQQIKRLQRQEAELEATLATMPADHADHATTMYSLTVTRRQMCCVEGRAQIKASGGWLTRTSARRRAMGCY